MPGLKRKSERSEMIHLFQLSSSLSKKSEISTKERMKNLGQLMLMFRKFRISSTKN